MSDVHIDIEAEQSVIGSVMLDCDAYDKVTGIISSADFYRPAHRTLFDAVGRCWDKHGQCDIILLQDELRLRDELNEIGGADYLFACVESVPTASNAEHYAKVVKRRAQRSNAMAVLAEHAMKLRDDNDLDVENLISSCQTNLDHVLNSGSSDRVIHMRQAYESIFAQLDTIGGDNYGIPIGLQSVRNISVAMVPGELGIIGARPGVGKSAFAFSILDYAATMGHPGAIISCEMSAEQFAWRNVARLSDIDLKLIFQGRTRDHHVDKIAVAINKCYDRDIYFVDAVGLTMDQIYPICRRLSAMGVKLFMIDHIQLIKPNNSNAPRRDQLADISRDCKLMAGKLKSVVLALSQLSRAVEKRVEARPTIADLKESGDIEANADFIWMLWRKLQDENAKKLEVEPAEVIVAKNRMLDKGVAKVGWYGKRFSFVDLEEQHDAA